MRYFASLCQVRRKSGIIRSVHVLDCDPLYFHRFIAEQASYLVEDLDQKHKQVKPAETDRLAAETCRRQRRALWVVVVQDDIRQQEFEK
jgi:hypothetical protein